MLTGLFVLALWWGATQVLLWMVRAAEPDELNAGALVIAGAAGVVALVSSADPTAAGALLGFTAGLALWAAFEIAFLTGAVLGIPAQSADAPAGTGLPAPIERLWCALGGTDEMPRFATTARGGRAWAAFRAILWHELALVLMLAILAAMLARSENPMAFYVFALLWAMRVSAKLNLFLGVRNHCAEFLPRAVRHLSVHFTDAPMNRLFPASVFAGTLASALLLRAALDPSAGDGEAVRAGLLAVLCALGTLEHWMMMTPLSPLKLWSTNSPRVTVARTLGPMGQVL